MKISKLQALTDYKKDITVSVGHIQGGRNKFNIVCGTATAKIDTRFSSITDANELDQKFKKIVRASFTCAHSDKLCPSTSIEVIDDAPPFAPEKKSLKFINKYKKLARRISGDFIYAKKSGGAADTNYMSRKGLIIIDGLGPVGGNIHTKKEFLVIKSLQDRIDTLSEFLIYAMDNL